MKQTRTVALLAIVITSLALAACNKEPEKPVDSSAEDIKAIREMMEKEQAEKEWAERSRQATAELLLCYKKVPPDGDTSVCARLEQRKKEVDAARKQARK